MPEKLPASKRKILLALKKTKGRREHGLFTVEGERGVMEMLAGNRHSLRWLVATPGWIDNNKDKISKGGYIYEISPADMSKLSVLVTPQPVIGVFDIYQPEIPTPAEIADSLVLALDDVQDPGNMGTMIRLADWWGITYILCSENTVDCYNPKVIQSAMGALSRVKVVKLPSLAGYLHDAANEGVTVYGTFLNGENLFKTEPAPGIIVMGNEGNGITPETTRCITRRITIPSYPSHKTHVESLNVATAAATILSHFRSFYFAD